MKLRVLFAVILPLACGLIPLSAQSGKRIAITVDPRGKFPDQQNLIASSMVSKLAGEPGLTIIDNERVEQVLKQQDQQNSDRYSPENAVRIGRLLGANLFAVVQVEYFIFTAADQKSAFGAVKKNGTVNLRASVRITNVETGVILSQPVSSYQETRALTQTSTNTVGSILAKHPVQSSSGDAAAEGIKLAGTAIDTVAAELTTKVLGATHESGEAGAGLPPVAIVAGIANGAVYINKGSQSGVKTGDRYNVVRVVDLPLFEPGSTTKHLTSKKTICTLVIANVDEGNSSGSCQGGLPQSEDSAQPLPR